MRKIRMQLSDRFQAIISDTISFETGGDKSGAYTNDPVDPGGETKWGISKRAHPELDIKSLTYKDAIKIYATTYWSPMYDLIPSLELTFKVFDMGVLSGKPTAVKLLQQAIVASGKTIAVDGDFGPITLTALNVVYAQGNGDRLYKLYIMKFVNRTNRTVFFKPWLRKYKMGWIKRITCTCVPKVAIDPAQGTSKSNGAK